MNPYRISRTGRLNIDCPDVGHRLAGQRSRVGHLVNVNRLKTPLPATRPSPLLRLRLQPCPFWIPRKDAIKIHCCTHTVGGPTISHVPKYSLQECRLIYLWAITFLTLYRPIEIGNDLPTQFHLLRNTFKQIHRVRGISENKFD